MTDAERGSRPFWDDRLTRSENKAVEMALNGFLVREIAEEMDTAEGVVRKYLSFARKKGVSVPRMPHPPRRDVVATADLVRARKSAIASSGRYWGVCAILARRFDMSRNAVKVRLWQHDQKQKRVGR